MTKTARLRWAMAVVTIVDLWLMQTDQPRLDGLARSLGHSSEDFSSPWWTWIAGLRGWKPPDGAFKWEASWAWNLVSRPVRLATWLLFFGVGLGGALALAMVDNWDRAGRSPFKIALGLLLLVSTGWALEDIALAIRAGNPFQTAADLVQNPGFGGYLELVG